MSDDTHLKFVEYVRSYSWQELASLLKSVGPTRAEQLVTSPVDPEKHATALIVCARSTHPPDPTSSSSSSSSTTTDTTTATNSSRKPGETEDGDNGADGLLETCQVLVKYGADLNYRDRGGRSALHWAVGSNKTQLTALLLSMGADVGSPDNSGHTALHTAICAGNQSCVALLLQHDRQVSSLLALPYSSLGTDAGFSIGFALLFLYA